MKKAVIYGSTGTGKNVYSLVKERYDVLYFVDEDKQCGRICKAAGECSDWSDRI